MQSLWMLFAMLVFSIMGVCVKYASALYSTSEIVAYRGVIGALFIFLMTRMRGDSLKTTLPWHHLWRGTVGVVALWLWFYSFSKLPLAMATTLNYTAPIWIAAILLTLGWWRRTQHAEWHLVCAILASFCGVLLLLQPAIQSDQWGGALIALSSGMLSALAYLQVRKLGHMGEPEYRVVFYFALTSVFAGLLTGQFAGMLGGADSKPLTWFNHTPRGLILLLVIGATATIAQVAMTRAFRLGKALVTANLQYTGIIFASFWGIMLWDDRLGWLGWSGIALILVSGVATTFFNTRSTQPVSTPPADVIANEV
jgi:S-adenosylmethionine uptake transporter